MHLARVYLANPTEEAISLITANLIRFLPGTTAHMLCIFVKVCADRGSIFGELETLCCVRLGQAVMPLHHDPDLWKISIVFMFLLIFQWEKS